MIRDATIAPNAVCERLLPERRNNHRSAAPIKKTEGRRQFWPSVCHRPLRRSVSVHRRLLFLGCGSVLQRGPRSTRSWARARRSLQVIAAFVSFLPPFASSLPRRLFSTGTDLRVIAAVYRRASARARSVTIWCWRKCHRAAAAL